MDIFHFFDQIKNIEHNSAFDCSFKDMEFILETVRGYESDFKFQCKMCQKISLISTEKNDKKHYIPINKAVVSGSISIGMYIRKLIIPN